MRLTNNLLHRISIALAVAGLLVAAYLTYSGLSDSDALCRPGGGCDRVRQSAYAEVLGVPVALIGVLGYLGILAVLLFEKSVQFFTSQGPMIIFGLSLIGFLYSLYLTYLELFVLFAICPYCVASAVIMTLIFALATYRVVGSVRA